MTHEIINRFNGSIVSVAWSRFGQRSCKTEGRSLKQKRKKKKGITLTSNWVVFMRDTDEKKIIDRVNLFKAKK